MNYFRPLIFAVLALPLTALAQVADPVVVEDEGVTLTRTELENLVARLPPNMREIAAKDYGDQLEVINLLMVTKKMAKAADETLEPGTEAFYRYWSTVNGVKRDFLIEYYAQQLEVPDMTELAKERYETEKEKFALVKEKRLSSHILFACPPGTCDREEIKVSAQGVLDELRQGADFVEMVQKHSGDDASKAKDGLFDKWLIRGEPHVSGYYTTGVFEIDEVGEYSDIVSTRYGVHIIRLDGIEEEHFLPYEEVAPLILSELEGEYRQLAAKEFRNRFNMTEEVLLNRSELDQIFGSGDQ
ncbi:MAG: peptidylprolyl isomerase [Pseudomonadota bacterium]